jgi:hypothetical protein
MGSGDFLQDSVAGPIPFASDVTKGFEHLRDGFEILEALQFVLFDLVSFVAHVRHFKQDSASAPA